MNTALEALPVTLEDVQAASHRLRGMANPTPLQISRSLSAVVGAEVWLKPECLQRTGSFKFRGAFNRLSTLTAGERERGVITYSSGNHGQAIACAGGILGIRTVIVMPENAVPSKVEAARGYGAEVDFAGLTSLDRQSHAEDLSSRQGYTIVPPFDDPGIIAGQGTAGLEILEDLPDVGVVLVPVGGGGLLSGVALSIRSQRPDVQVIGVEPEGAADARDSLREGHVVTRTAETVCDGLRTSRIGHLNFEVMRRFVTSIVTVGDEAALDAVRFLALRARLVVEPSGAVAAAALLHGSIDVRGRKVVALLSGGNIEPGQLAKLLRPESGASGPS